MSPETSSPSREKVPVLLVDDNLANLLALQAVLHSSDYELVMVPSGQDAVHAVSQQDFAVILLDVQMPELDGFDTAALIKKQTRGPRFTPIIFVTGVDGTRSRLLRAYAEGAVDYIVKPLDPEVIRAKVAVFAELFRVRQQLTREQTRAGKNARARQLAEDALLRDFSRRRAAEEELQASERRFHHLVEAVTDYAIFALDQNGCVATWNAGAKKVKGYESAEIIGKHFSIFHTDEDRAAGKAEKILDVVRRDGRFEVEGWRVRKDGTRFWADVVITALRDQHAEITGFAKVTRDLTQRRLAEENARRLVNEQCARAASETERHRLLTLLEQVPAVVNFLRGPELVFEFAHPKTIEALGGRNVLGKPLSQAVPEVSDQPQHHVLRRVYETGEPIIEHEAPAWHEIEGRRAEAYWNSVHLPVRDASGAVEGVMTFALDVTENVLVRRELERLNRAKDEFLATVSHELRSPLNAIYGWTTILRKGPLDYTRLVRGLEVIERNARTQTRLVSDLLDVSRIVGGTLQLRLAKTEVSPVIHESADVVRPAADAKGVRLLIDLDPEVGATMADPDRLRQIMWNLLSNAVRFTPRGGRITVTASRTGSRIAICVRDTGVGIAPEHLPHIFERFTQVDSSTSRSHGGLGLGLAIVRHLVESHGGTVEAQSDGLGHGTTFSVGLPIRAVNPARDEHDMPMRVAAPTEVVEPARDVTLQNVRVLVVDDDLDSIEILRLVLEGAGATVKTATSAREALDASGAFEIIISDIGMPEMDGYTFMRRIRSRESGADVPAIALTAYARAEDVERARRAGYQEHLAKPVDEVRLLEVVKTWSHLATLSASVAKPGCA
jgi:PAS domain S-box-containing protein